MFVVYDIKHMFYVQKVYGYQSKPYFSLRKFAVKYCEICVYIKSVSKLFEQTVAKVKYVKISTFYYTTNGLVGMTS